MQEDDEQTSVRDYRVAAAWAHVGSVGAGLRAAGASGGRRRGSRGAGRLAGRRTEIAAGDIVKTEDTNLIVAGAAGICSRRGSLGIDFILCEKNDSVQETRGYLGVGGALKAALAQGGEVDVGYQRVDAMRPANAVRTSSRFGSTKAPSCWIGSMRNAGYGQAAGMVDLLAHATGGTDYCLRYWHAQPALQASTWQVLQASIEAGNQIASGTRWCWYLRRQQGDWCHLRPDDGYVRINAKSDPAGSRRPIRSRRDDALHEPSAGVLRRRGAISDVAGLKAGMPRANPDAAPIAGAAPYRSGRGCGYHGRGRQGAAGTIFQERTGGQPFMKVDHNGVRFANGSALRLPVAQAAASPV